MVTRLVKTAELKRWTTDDSRVQKHRAATYGDRTIQQLLSALSNTIKSRHLLLLAPFVLFAHLFFFGRCEIVLDVKRLANLLGRLAFDHVGDSLARHVK